MDEQNVNWSKNIYLLHTVITALLKVENVTPHTSVLNTDYVCKLLSPLVNRNRIHIRIQDGWVNVDERIQFKLLKQSSDAMRNIVTNLITAIYNESSHALSKHLGYSHGYSILSSTDAAKHISPHFYFASNKSRKGRERELHLTILDSGLILESFDNTQNAEIVIPPKTVSFKLI